MWANIFPFLPLLSPRRAYWGFHQRFPAQAVHLFDSLDPQLQKHVSDEKTALEKEGGLKVGLGVVPTASR